VRLIERHPEGQARAIRRTPKRDQRLVEYLTEEIEQAYSARQPQDILKAELLRMYKGVPKTPYRHVPIENAPNLEVTIGATEVDGIYASAIELLFAISPTLTARATRRDAVADAKAMQKWVNWGAANEWGLRPAAETAILEDCQFGTGYYFCPWVESYRHTDIGRVVDVGPRLLAIPGDDFLVPGGSWGDLEALPWCAMRSWLTAGELAERAKLRKWKTDGFAPAGKTSYLRERREDLANTRDNTRQAQRFEVHAVYPRFDYHGEGLAQDLLVIFDRTSKQLGAVAFQPYDQRPFEVMRYQLQPFLWDGLGPLEMIRPFQEEVTEIHCSRLLNAYLANCREFKARPGTVRGGVMTRYPGKVHEVSDPVADLLEMRMSDVYPSALYNEEQTTQLAQRRVGSNPTQGKAPLASSRTPGITAAQFLQVQNRRFVPAFDGMRIATGAAVRQCCARYRERLLAGDTRAEQNILRVLGREDGDRVVRLLKSDGFEEMVSVELSASSAMLNREADKQNALQLVNVLGQYYGQVVNYLGLASNPQTPEPVKQAALEVVRKGTELMDRTVRTFDQIRDPETFLLDAGTSAANVANHLADPMTQMQALLAGLRGGAEGATGDAGGAIAGPGTPLPNSGAGSV
jgi:hypothetical protein